MDERHWWIATRVQETFHIGEADNPAILEEFFIREENLDLLNTFLEEDATVQRLFFYANVSRTNLNPEHLSVTSNIEDIRCFGQDAKDNIHVLFFLRHQIDHAIQVSNPSKEIFCGEIKQDFLENLNGMLSETFSPIIKNKQNWGICTNDQIGATVGTIDKLSHTLSETTRQSLQTTKHKILREKTSLTGGESAYQRIATLDPEVLEEYEKLVTEWITVIEGILFDNSDDRLMDPNVGPLAELDRWHRRHRTLTTLTEQLKGKECKSIIGALITGKSRLLKKWKTVDISITEVVNDTRDKVKYLEGLRRYFVQLYENPTPQQIVAVILPGIFGAMKQMDSASRYYSRSGYLGQLCVKITNQLVIASKTYLKDLCMSSSEEDRLWELVQKEMDHLDTRDFQEITAKQLKAMLDTKVKAARSGGVQVAKTGPAHHAANVHTRDSDPDLGLDQTCLVSRIRACLLLQLQYKEQLRSLREILGKHGPLSHGSAQSGLNTIGGPKSAGADSQSTPSKTHTSAGSPLKRGHSTVSNPTGDNTHGVSIYEDETLMGHLAGLCARLRGVLEVLSVMHQVNSISKRTVGLPRPRQVDIHGNEDEDDVKGGKGKKEKDQAWKERREEAEAEAFGQPASAEGGALAAISEDAEEQEAADSDRDLSPLKGKLTAQQSDDKEELELMNKYYTGEGEGPSVSEVVRIYQGRMMDLVSNNITIMTMLDVESKEKGKFDEIYGSFGMMTREWEKFLCAYLHAIMLRPMTTHEAIDILSRFTPVQYRTGLRGVMSEKMCEVFGEFEDDLLNVKEMYEKYKNNPPRTRNAPPVAGAIDWSRKLLKELEDPMKVFRENRAVTSMKDYSRVVKIYNKIATALVTFESLYYTQWRNTIEIGRGGLKATVITMHPETLRLAVNIDPHLLELIQETKWLLRLGVDAPESARALLAEEVRIKSFEQNLQECVRRFYEVIDDIPVNLRPLFRTHIEATKAAFQPGESTLAWNSMNIDPFLHQLITATGRLEQTSQQVQKILKCDVDAALERIYAMVLLDYELAFSRTWPPDEFVQIMSSSIRTKVQDVKNEIEKMENGLKMVASLLTNKKVATLDQRKSYPTKALHTTNNNITEYELMSELLNHYYIELYSAVLAATCRTLVVLAESAGCQPDQVARAVTPLLTSPRGSSPRGSETMSPSPLQESSPPTPSGPPPLSAGSQIREEEDEQETRDTSTPAGRRSVLSRLSTFSGMTWHPEGSEDITFLKFAVDVRYSVPKLVIQPDMPVVQRALSQVSRASLAACKEITWFHRESRETGEVYYQQMMEDSSMMDLLGQIDGVTGELWSNVRRHLQHFGVYDFLWKDNLKGNFFEFMKYEPTQFNLKSEISRLLRLVNQIRDIPDEVPVGCVCLQSRHTRDVLQGFSMGWKETYAEALHVEAKRQLYAVVDYREDVCRRIEMEVVTLEQLNQTLHLLEELADMENTVDGIYLPIENLYAQLGQFEKRLPRNEVEDVNALRYKWQELLDLAEEVRTQLLKERKMAFQQELDKQIKAFVVEVIQFRNAFDSQGPAVPGIQPSDAVVRLQDFQQLYGSYDTKRTTLDSVSKLFGLPCKSFPELDKTGEELELLGLLYGLFQQFIRFDIQFRDTLWAEVDLDATSREVENYWDESLALPSKLKDWEAYHDMKGRIQGYLQVLPLLKKLAAKEIRNRHWLQVMQVTGSSFLLEANVFKLDDLMDIGLVPKKSEIEEICRCAQREQQLEVRMRQTEEEWTEQVLAFQTYKRRGHVLIDKPSTARFLEQLDDSQAMLAGMLTSRYIGPLREEAASWAEKLREVGEVLEMWLDVQDLWLDLEAVFSQPETAKEMPQEAKRFDRLDRSYMKTMKRAFDTKNLLQCCLGGEVPKGVVLRHILEELEICYKSLLTYLDQKRKSFPRFYFVTNAILLSMLSRPNSLESVRPYLRYVFSAIWDLRWERRVIDEPTLGLGTSRSASGYGESSRGSGAGGPRLSRVSQQVPAVGEGPKRVPSISHQSGLQNRVSGVLMGDEFNEDDYSAIEVTTVTSADGEELLLDHKVALGENVETWLSEIQFNTAETLKRLSKSVIHDIDEGGPLDELAFKYPAQICRLGLQYYWTKECEMSIVDVKNERKALQNLSKKYNTMMTRLPTVLYRGAWKTIEEKMQPFHKVRLENMISQAMYLRDALENLTNKKIRETTDFEWRRTVRCYVHKIGDDEPRPNLYVMDERFEYGCEFYGAGPVLALTPLTERCFIAMVTAMTHMRGCLVQGPAGVGKTECVRGLAQMLGYHLLVVQAREHYNLNTVGQVLQGLSVDGCWGLFDDVHKFQAETLAVLMDHMQAVMNALKAGESTCAIGDGPEFSINRLSSVTLTCQPAAVEGLPKELKAHFRGVSLVSPDWCQILKAKATGLGYKAPHVLATRLKIVAELVKDHFPNDRQNQFTIATMIDALYRASLRRRSTKEDSLGKQDSNLSQAQGGLSYSEYWPPYRERSMAAMSAMPGRRSMKQADLAGSMKPTFGKKAATPNPLSPAAKMEHGFVSHALFEMLAPRLEIEHQTLLRSILRDVFYGIPEPTKTQLGSAEVQLEQVIARAAKEKGLVAHRPWLEKCIQLYNLASVNQGLIISGSAGTGKTAALESLVGALSSSQGASIQFPQLGSAATKSRVPTSTADAMTAERSHRLHRIFPHMMDDSELLFGHMRSEEEWVDGVFTATWRKASRNQAITWMCLDGPLLSEWTDNFNSVLDSNRVLHLAHGERLTLGDNMKLVFETESMCDASPAFLARTGVVHFGEEVLGWRPIAHTWLTGRSAMEVQTLGRAFDKTMDAIIGFIWNETRPMLQIPPLAAFQSCLSLLGAMLSENKEMSGEMHVERLYLMCLLWCYGGFLVEADRKTFSDLLKTLTAALPDDDRDINVFDYYVDESGEWDPWISRVPEAVCMDNLSLLGECLVDTVDTVRVRMFMDFAYLAKRNILLVGPRGSGKSALINDFNNRLDQSTIVNHQLIFSAATAAAQVQSFVEVNLHHRQGFVYGARDNRHFQVCIDDLNMPRPTNGGVQRCNELLRQLLDAKTIITSQRPFEWRTVEDLNVVATVATSDTPGVVFKEVDQRLMRHFVVLQVPDLEGDVLRSVVRGIFQAHLTFQDQAGLDIDVVTNLMEASCRLLEQVKDVLRMSELPGRQHYLFNLKDLNTAALCLRRMPDESRAEEHSVLDYWTHEMCRIFRDGICRTSDLLWFDETFDTIIKEVWPNLEVNKSKIFVTFPNDCRHYQRPGTSQGSKQVKVVLQEIDKLDDVRETLTTQLNRYNEEFGNEFIELTLSNNVIGHIVRVHRVMCFPQGGHMLLVGAIGAHLSTLCRLALHVADLPVHSLDTSKKNSYFESLRSAVREAGSEGKIFTLLLTGRGIDDEMVLDSLNSLLTCGYYPQLFSNDEMDGLLQAIIPSLKKENPGVVSDPMRHFVARVRSNLHVVLCLPPLHPLLKTSIHSFPALFTRCQINCFCDWPLEALLAEVDFFIEQHGELGLTDRIFTAKTSEKIEEGDPSATSPKEDEKTSQETDRSLVARCLAEMHHFVLGECNQTLWAGDIKDTIQVNQLKVIEKKKDVVKVIPSNMPNRPYSKVVMLEQVRSMRRLTDRPAVREIPTGPLTLRRLMSIFHYLYTRKCAERCRRVDLLERVLVALDQCRHDSQAMRKAVKDLRTESDEACATSARLLKTLTLKVTRLEKLKAGLGQSSSLNAFLQLHEFEEEQTEEETLLATEEYDDFDKEFDRLREESLKNRQIQAKEDLIKARENLESCRKDLEYAKEQVYFWKGRVDRPCIERIKAFQNPPALVGQVMEMIFFLIGKSFPGMSRFDKPAEPAGYPAGDNNSGRMSAASAGGRSTGLKKEKTPSKGTKEAQEKVDKATWKYMQQSMTDTMKFQDMLHNIAWEDGLDIEVQNAVESYLAKGKDGQLGVTGEGTLLENAETTTIKARKATAASSATGPMTSESGGITISSAKYSSEDAATLVQYSIALVEYSGRCRPLRKALDRVHELEREVEDTERAQKEKEDEAEIEEMAGAEKERDEEIAESDLPRLQEEVDDIQRQYDTSIVEKYRLGVQLRSMEERLRACVTMTDSLGDMEEGWRQFTADNPSDDVLLANCLISAAFLTYCGGMDNDERRRFSEHFIQLCEANHLLRSPRIVFRDIDLVNFLFTDVDVMALAHLRLPVTPLQLENACFLMLEDHCDAWPLLCDASRRAVTWLQQYLQKWNVVVIKYDDMRLHLENALSDGVVLVITDCDPDLLAKDRRLRQVLVNKHRFIGSQTPFKLLIQDHEVECQPSFRLFLHSTAHPCHIPIALAAYTALVKVSPSRRCLEEDLLDRFLRIEKARLETEWTETINDKLDNLRSMCALEEQMVDHLSSGARLAEDLPLTRKLAELKKQHYETVESQSRVQATEETVLKARESYRVIARRGAVCFDVTQQLAMINPLYLFSYQQFLSIYETAIQHSDRASTKAVVDRLTFACHQYTSRALLEQDRFIYSMLLALEVCDSIDQMLVGEREFIISPQLGAAVVIARQWGSEGRPTESRFMVARKPFDWMLDEQFTNIQLLAANFDWFQEMFDRMSRDGRETQWRNMVENEQPEHSPLPDKMDEVLNPVQRLCIMRAVRSDRLVQMSYGFMATVLGKKFLTDNVIDLSTVIRGIPISVPIMMLYQHEAGIAEKLFTDLASKRTQSKVIVQVNDASAATERVVRRTVLRCMNDGSWVLLHTASSSPAAMLAAASLITEHAATSDPAFRCFISAEMTLTLPKSLVQSCIRIVIDSPKAVKDNLLRSFSLIDNDLLRVSNRTEWPPALHNLFFMHASLRLRNRFVLAGWHRPSALAFLGDEEVRASLEILQEEMREQLTMVGLEHEACSRGTAWQALKYILAEIIYGGSISNTYDQQTLTAFLDFWMSPNSMKKDFEVTRLKYKIPPIFLSPNLKMASVNQAIEAMPPFFLDCPEACLIHATSENILGTDQYVFTRLNAIYDQMPSSETLRHNLFDRPVTPADTPIQSMISMNTQHPLVVPLGKIASGSLIHLRTRKEAELWELCHSLLPKVPKSYTRDYIVDRIKKIGGPTVYNNFLARELEILFKLVNEMRSTLTSIKNAIELENLGDRLTPDEVLASDALLHNRLPPHWLKLAGQTAPPASQPPTQWLTELGQRCQHLERILVLGREKMPAYWLGAFTNPRALLALLKQESYLIQAKIDRTGNLESVVFQTEMTSRDKDHLRDPPSEGFFIYGFHLWGCSWDKTAGELSDHPPKVPFASLPVIHITCIPVDQSPLHHPENPKSLENFACPVFHSRYNRDDPVTELNLHHDGIPASRWALRGVFCTLRPY